MKIGIIVAMPEEFRAVAKSLGAATAAQIDALKAGNFSLAGHKFMLVESGMGFRNADKAAEIMVQDARPDLLVSTGFCGGVAPELMAGDIVVAQEIIIADKDGFDAVPIQLSSIGQNFVVRQTAGVGRVVAGTFISASVIMSKKRLAGMLTGSCPSPVVEMESGAIALVAAENNIPMLAIRAVSDSVAEELGFSLDEFCDSEMRRISTHKVLLTVLRKPRIIPQLVRLSRSSRRAVESLTATLSCLFSDL
jgi:adenosylhomocysteine nucleosidase